MQEQQIKLISVNGSYSNLVWNGCFFKIVRIAEQWLDAGEWWQGEPEKLFLRVQLENDALLEVYREVGQPTWHLYKVYD